MPHMGPELLAALPYKSELIQNKAARNFFVCFENNYMNKFNNKAQEPNMKTLASKTNFDMNLLH